MIAIIIPTWDNNVMLLNTINSIKYLTDGIDYKIIVVDNGSKEKVIAENVIRNESNLGYIKACNQALDTINDEDILLLNDDIIITDNMWLVKLYSLLHSKDNIGIVGPTSNYVLGLQNIQYSINSRYHYSPYIIGFCMLIKNSVFKKIGKLDEQFGLGGEEDIEYSFRARLNDYKLVVDRTTFVYHIGSVSISKIDTDYLSKRNLLYNKYGKDKVEGMFYDY